MKNLIQSIENLTNLEKDLLLYYSLVGISVSSKNDYIAGTNKSVSVINQIASKLKKKGLLVRTEDKKLKVINR